MGKDSNWGYESYLTEDQRQVLVELRKKVKEELPPKEYLQKDSSLLRYLRARAFNLNKTWTMLKEDVEWRDPFEGYVFQRKRDFGGAYALHEMGAIHMTGKSKLGNPVISVLARAYNPKLVEDNIQIVYFFVFYIDALCRIAEQAGQETFFGIFDLEGFSLSNFSLSQMKMVISILQNHYPERLGGIFVINAPWAFTAVWKLIKPLLDDRTRNKISILGGDYIAALTEHIDIADIEEKYGGKHGNYAIPDDIVQVALDNEHAALEVAKKPAIIVAPVTAAAPVPPVTPSSNGIASPMSTGSFKVKSKKSTVNKLMKKMMFLSDKREDGGNGALDESYVNESNLPQAPEEVVTATLQIELDNLTKSLLEARMEQEKFTAQVAVWKQLHEKELTKKRSEVRFLQAQIVLLTLLVLLSTVFQPYLFTLFNSL